MLAFLAHQFHLKKNRTPFTQKFKWVEAAHQLQAKACTLKLKILWGHQLQAKAPTRKLRTLEGHQLQAKAPTRKLRTLVGHPKSRERPWRLRRITLRMSFVIYPRRLGKCKSVGPHLCLHPIDRRKLKKVSRSWLPRPQPNQPHIDRRVCQKIYRIQPPPQVGNKLRHGDLSILRVTLLLYLALQGSTLLGLFSTRHLPRFLPLLRWTAPRNLNHLLLHVYHLWQILRRKRQLSKHVWRMLAFLLRLMVLRNKRTAVKFLLEMLMLHWLLPNRFLSQNLISKQNRTTSTKRVHRRTLNLRHLRRYRLWLPELLVLNPK